MNEVVICVETEQWYQQLIEDCKDIITEAVFTSRWALVEGYHMLGERIVTDNNLQWHAKGNESYLQGLADNIRTSLRTLHYAVQFYQKYPRLDAVPEGKNITWNKLITKYLPHRQLPELALPRSIKGVTLIHGDMIVEVPQLGKFDLVVADPPYGVTNWEWDKIPDYKRQITQWLQVLKTSFAQEYQFFWFCSPKWVADTEMVFRDLDIPIKSRIVWHRRNMSMGSDAQDKFIDTWEMIIHSGNTSLNWPSEWDSSRFDVQTFAVPQTNFTDAKLHPTQKPLDLIKWLVSYGSKPSKRVLDPFAGAGTTGMACEGIRECVLIEKETEYIDIIKARLGI